MSDLANNKNMLNNQLRVCDINNKNLLNAIKSTKRSIFVPEKFKKSAYIFCAALISAWALSIVSCHSISGIES